ARTEAEAQRQARQRTEVALSNSQIQGVQAEANRVSIPPAPAAIGDSDAAKNNTRRRLLEELNGAAAAPHTARGLVVTIGGEGFSGTGQAEPTMHKIMRVAAILATTPGLRISVEGHSDTSAEAALFAERARLVRDVLVRAGLSGDRISAQGF